MRLLLVFCFGILAFGTYDLNIIHGADYYLATDLKGLLLPKVHVEEHKAVSKGYNLVLHRLSKNESSGLATVVLLWHGIMDSSEGLFTPTESSLPQLLVNEGYDVWIANSRESKYSYPYASYQNPGVTEEMLDEYWNFSWQDVAQTDLFSVFKYIKGHVGGRKINFIGHNQGNTIMFACLADPNPTLDMLYVSENLETFAALAPLTYLNGVTSSLFETNSKNLLNTQKNFGLFANNSNICFYYKYACSGIFDYLDEYKDLLLITNHSKIWPEKGSYLDSGFSKKSLLHFRQQQANGKFQKFDYGSAENSKRYNSTQPTEYQPYLIHHKIGMFVGTGDKLANAYDATALFTKIKSDQKEIHFYTLGNLGFVIGNIHIYKKDLLKFIPPVVFKIYEEPTESDIPFPDLLNITSSK